MKFCNNVSRRIHLRMYLVKKTSEFDKWLKKLKDKKAKARILVRLQRIEENGNFGDCQPIGEALVNLGYTMLLDIGFTQKSTKGISFCF